MPSVLSVDLIDEKLVACGNIMAPHTALYAWEGKSVREIEIAALLKTTEDKFAAVDAYIQLHNGYETPCIIGWNTEAAHAPFESWVKDAVTQA